MSYFDFDFDLCCACSPRHPRQRKSFETTDSLSISRARDYDTTTSVVAAAESNKQERTGEGSRHPRAASEFCSKRAEPASRREPRASHLRGAIGLLLDGGYA